MKPRGHSTLAKFPCFTFFLFIWKLPSCWKLPSLSGKKDWHSQCLSPMPSQHTFAGQSLGPAPWSAGAPGRCPETCSEDPTPCIYGNQTPLQRGSHPCAFMETRPLSPGHHHSPPGYSSPGILTTTPSRPSLKIKAQARSLPFGVTSFPKVMFRWLGCFSQQCPKQTTSLLAPASSLA